MNAVLPSGSRTRSGAVARHPASVPPPGLLRPLVDAIDTAVKEQRRRNPFRRDPAVLRQALPLIKAVNGYFGTEVRGWHNVPQDRGVLIVGNHSGGAETTDVAPLLERWIEERGSEALYMLGYDLLLAIPVLSPFFQKLGLLRANPALAQRALARGAAVVVFPGGDYEVFRPWRDRNRIDFGGRTGFVALAIAAGVPVVPMTIHGAHESTIVLTRGQRLARWLGLPKVHIKVFPFILNIPFGVTPAFIPSIKFPAKVTVAFGKPLDWSHYARERAADPEVQRRCYDEITGVMQHTLDGLAREHPHPVLERFNELRPSRLLRHLVNGNGARRPAHDRKGPLQRARRNGHGG